MTLLKYCYKDLRIALKERRYYYSNNDIRIETHERQYIRLSDTYIT